MMRQLWALTLGSILLIGTVEQAAQAQALRGGPITPNIVAIVPPSLHHPLIYAAGLMAQLTVFSFAMVVIFYMLSGLNIKRDGCVCHGRWTWQSAVNAYRLVPILLMTTITLAVMPNLMASLAWGEVSGETMSKISVFNQLMKVIALFPFLGAIYLLVEHEEGITFKLALENSTEIESIWPERQVFKEYYRVIALVVLLVVGVTVAKAGIS